MNIFSYLEALETTSKFAGDDMIFYRMAKKKFNESGYLKITYPSKTDKQLTYIFEREKENDGIGIPLFHRKKFNV